MATIGKEISQYLKTQAGASLWPKEEEGRFKWLVKNPVGFMIALKKTIDRFGAVYQKSISNVTASEVYPTRLASLLKRHPEIKTTTVEDALRGTYPIEDTEKVVTRFSGYKNRTGTFKLNTGAVMHYTDEAGLRRFVRDTFSLESREVVVTYVAHPKKR